MPRAFARTPADERQRARDAVLQAFAATPAESSLEGVAERVAASVAVAEPSSERLRWQERFSGWLRRGLFLPSIPALSNAGRGGQLAACFVLEAEDSLASIYQTLGRAAAIQQGSGGTGVHLSNLRPAGTPIERSGGETPGPVGFLELFASSARINRRAGRRPGAHLAVLRHDHPDVLEFVRAKLVNPEPLAGLGLALSVGDGLLAAAGAGAAIDLVDGSGRRTGSVQARALLHEIALAIHATGEPSLLFVDAIERANPVPELGPLRATNPCGEQPLLPGESCVLGSLHLPAFAGDDGELDFAALSEATRDAVRFLDDLIDVNRFPDDAIADATRRTRKIGLGVMGLADLFLLRGLQYGSEHACSLARHVLHFVHARAAEASEALGAERGAFPAWHGRGTMRRNASLLAVAPTGTLCLITGCSPGIEPFLHPAMRVKTPAGDALWVDRWLEAWAGKHASEPESLVAALLAQCPASELPGLSRGQRALLRRAWEIDPEHQLQLQSGVQRQIDGAVSKTVHLPPSCSPEAIEGWIRLAHRLGCKGVSFFRRGCAADSGAPPGAAVELRLDTPLCLTTCEPASDF